jgi:NAD(P)H-hydrate epimerase
MKILSAAQIRELDAYTIQQEPVSSVQLMERAATACTAYLLNNFQEASFTVLAGTGNNGGDGLAIARLLDISGMPVDVILAGSIHSGSADFKTNLERLKLRPQIAVNLFKSGEEINLKPKNVIVDCLFGTGLNKPVAGEFKQLIQSINASANTVISIDVPSGLASDLGPINPEAEIVKADLTLTFHVPKITFMFEPFAQYVGKLEILDIGLNREFHDSFISDSHFLLKNELAALVKQRERFSYKNSFGHGLLLAGSKGKIGAAILSGSAFLKAGAGLLTSHIPACGYVAMQTALPEAMCSVDENENYISKVDTTGYDAIVAGPGLGINESTVAVLTHALRTTDKPVLLDADALTILSENPDLWQYLKNRACVLTPHPGEFDRLFHCGKDPVTQYQELRKQAIEKSCVIVLKGAYTRIACSDGNVYFNSSGNAGMATAGSGDVLSGIIGGLLCSGYSAKDAALLGVYLHGAAGDIYAQKEAQESLTASELINYLGQAWGKLHEAI